MSTLTDGPKKRLMTDYYGDGNKSLLLQDIEESSVIRVCFEGYRRNEQQDSVIDLIFTVELAGFGAVKLTQRIGYFEDGLEGYNDSLLRMDCTDRILLTDMEPFFNFEPCFDFFQLGENVASPSDCGYALYTIAKTIVNDKESMIVAKMIFNFSQVVYIDYIISRFTLDKPYFVNTVVDIFSSPVYVDNVFTGGELSQIYIPSDEELELEEKELEEGEEVTFNSIAIVEFKNTNYKKTIGLILDTVYKNKLSKLIYGSKVVTTDQDEIFSPFCGDNHCIMTIESLGVGFFRNNDINDYVTYNCATVAEYDAEDQKFVGKVEMIIYPSYTYDKIGDYLHNYRIKKTSRDI